MAAHFEPVVSANCRLVTPSPSKRTATGGYPKVASYDVLGEQLHYSNSVKHGHGCQVAGEDVASRLLACFKNFLKFFYKAMVNLQKKIGLHP